MNVTLRTATTEDYEAVSVLYDQLEQVHAQALPDFFRAVEGHARPHQWFADILADENATLFVAEEQGVIVGMVHCYIRSTPALPMIVPRRFVYVEDLVVNETARHQGVGRLLTERVHQWALEKEIREIELNVWEFPTSALTFYEKLGYQTTRRHMRKLFP